MVYFELVRRYGDVPWINVPINYSDPLLYSSRIDRSVIVDSIATDLDYAASKLYLPSQQPAEQYGRITRTGALAYKSRVMLYEGTLRKYHNKGNYTSLLQSAVNAANEVIQSKEHALYTEKGTSTTVNSGSYYYLFQIEGEGKANKENVIARLYGASLTNNISSHGYPGSLEQASMSPTKALIDAFLYSDGLPKEKSPLAKPDTDWETEFENRDPRLNVQAFTKGIIWRGGSSVYDPKDFWFTKTGYTQYKFYNDVDRTQSKSFTDHPTLRYAEVLLNYAEATYELNGSINDEILDKTVNELRQRVAFPVMLTNAFATANGLNIRDEIRRERRIELAGEGFRYYDLIRWKNAETELPKVVLGRMKFDEQGKALGYTIVQLAEKRAFDPQKDYLSPLPTIQLGLLQAVNKQGWPQNPKW